MKQIGKNLLTLSEFAVKKSINRPNLYKLIRSERICITEVGINKHKFIDWEVNKDVEMFETNNPSGKKKEI